MKNLLLLLFLSIQINSFSQEKREFEMKEGDTTYIMKQYFFCFYIRGEKTNQDSLTLAKLQEGHMAHINKMADEGVICLAGPFGDNTEKRGILLFDVATKEEAEEWVKKDPMVIEGRLTYEIHPWWGAKGSKLK